MPLQDVPSALLPAQLGLAHQVRSNGPHERLPIKIRRVFPSLSSKLINVKELTSANELLVYFVTGEEEPHSNW